MLTLELTLHPQRYNTTVVCYTESIIIIFFFFTESIILKKSLKIKLATNPVNSETNKEEKKTSK